MQSEIGKFKKDNPECDQWLPVQIDLWKEKKSMNKIKDKSSKINKQADKSDKSSRMSKSTNKSPKSSTANFTITPIKPEVKPHSNSKSAVIKRLDLTSTEDVIVSDTPEYSNKDHSNLEVESNPKKDSFFLTGDNSASEDEDDFENQDDNFQGDNVENYSKNRGKKFPPRQFGGNFANNQRNERFRNEPPSTSETSNKTLHPSWQARKLAKERQKISFNNPLAKKIKFD